MDILLTIVYFLVMVAVIIGSFILLKKFVFGKFTINKFIPLSISVLILGAQIFLRSENKIISSALTVVAVLFFAWFWDINETGGIVKKKEPIIKMKPKAKPNRVKNKK